jgi:hypothetical protein
MQLMWNTWWSWMENEWKTVSKKPQNLLRSQKHGNDLWVVPKKFVLCRSKSKMDATTGWSLTIGD